MLNKVVIPVAGKSTRLYPLTENTPKCMLPLGDKLVIERILDEIVSIKELTEVILIVSPTMSMIRDFLGDFYKGLNIRYVIQEFQDGLANAVYCAKDIVRDDSFVLILGDSIILNGGKNNLIQRMVEVYNRLNTSGVILVQETHIDELSRCGIVKPIDEIPANGEFEINDIIEKPTIEECPSKYSAAGLYVFAPDMFNCISNVSKGVNNEYQLTDAIKILTQYQSVWCVDVGEKNRIIDMGTLDAYHEACEIFRRNNDNNTNPIED